jgi:sulfur-oxidizing protein SoxY
MRRAVLRGAAWAGLGLAATRSSFAASGDPQVDELIERLTGGRATESARVQLQMPPVFGNGYSVPMTLVVDSPMTEIDHVRSVLIVAPKNPIVVVAKYLFTPQSGRAAVSTRIRLAEPQTVLAVAEMSDGALLMSGTRVKVDTNGCA